jgi:hypothetical protein
MKPYVQTSGGCPIRGRYVNCLALLPPGPAGPRVRRDATIQRMTRKRPLSVFLGFLAVSVLVGVQVARIGLAADSALDKDKKVPMLFVQTAKGATLVNGKLTLTGVSPLTVYFSDRPTRVAGHIATSEMVPLWSEGKDSFLKEPPTPRCRPSLLTARWPTWWSS